MADPYVFYSLKDPRLILVLWVDDGLAMCKDQQKLKSMISYLKTAFEITVGDADVYVGLHITRDRFKRNLYVDR